MRIERKYLSHRDQIKVQILEYDKNCHARTTRDKQILFKNVVNALHFQS